MSVKPHVRQCHRATTTRASLRSTVSRSLDNPVTQVLPYVHVGSVYVLIRVQRSEPIACDRLSKEKARK